MHAEATSGEFYTSAATSSFPLATNAVDRAIGKLVSKDVEAELAVGIGGHCRRGFERERDGKDGALFGKNCEERCFGSARQIRRIVERAGLTFDLRLCRDNLERPLRLLKHDARQSNKRGVLCSLHCDGLTKHASVCCDRLRNGARS